MPKRYPLIIFITFLIAAAVAPWTVSSEADDQTEGGFGSLLIKAMVKKQPTDATVFVDGKEVGTTPHTIPKIAPGPHTVRVSKPRYNDYQDIVYVEKGRKHTVLATLRSALRIIGDDGAEMILISAGNFKMGRDDGSTDERPVHTVYVDAFYIDKYEVTVGQYKRFIEATGHRALPPQISSPDQVAKFFPTDGHPAVGVSWHDAMAYVKWAGKTLPTEAQWEKAARGGREGKRYPWGDDISHDDANYSGTGRRDRWRYTAPVGRFSSSGYGLYDIIGNVWEWCMDGYDSDYYAQSPRKNPVAGGFISA